MSRFVDTSHKTHIFKVCYDNEPPFLLKKIKIPNVGTAKGNVFKFTKVVYNLLVIFK